MSKSPLEISMEKNRKWVNPNSSNSDASIRSQIDRMRKEVVLVYDFDNSGRYACSNCFERNGILQAPSMYISHVIEDHLRSKSCSQNRRINKSHVMIVQVNAKGNFVFNFSMMHLEYMPKCSNKKPSNEKPKDDVMTVEEFARERFAQLYKSFGARSKLHLLVIDFGGGTYACYNCFERNGIIKSPTRYISEVINEHVVSKSCFHNKPLPRDAVIMTASANGGVARAPEFVLLNDSYRSNYSKKRILWISLGVCLLMVLVQFLLGRF